MTKQVSSRAARQTEILSTADVLHYIKPLSTKWFWAARRHPEFPKPIQATRAGGKHFFARADIDDFLKRVAAGEVQV